MREIGKFLVLCSLGVGFAVLGRSQKGKRILNYVMGGMIAFLGAIGMVTGKIQQRYGMAAPLEGPLAVVGAAFIFLCGLYIIYIEATKSPADHSSANKDA